VAPSIMSDMKLAAATFLITAGCIPMPHEVRTTSYAELPEQQSEIIVAGTLDQTQQVLVEKLANRGFPLLDRRPTDNGIWLKFGGNRDFAGYDTIGSVFYAWVDPTGVVTSGTRVRMVGKPTLNHKEGCPSEDGTSCTPLTTFQTWGVSGHEEALAIHGVFSELALDGVVREEQNRTATR
jgi:hypothetical protein